MWSRSLALALLLLPAPALAGVKENVAALAPQGLVLVMDAKGNELVAQNTDEPFVPASVTKIVTAWLEMEVLGGDYRFKTRFYLDDKRVQDHEIILTARGSERRRDGNGYRGRVIKRSPHHADGSSFKRT